ncbi:MAG TPA: peptide-methionine (S)-S-oxide reductase MsrA [Longimicrobiales bacterium]|nr:peptide-methionine (S)-S-oxide reductase MsrA [Longimicrobiales bacterium]
MTEHATLGGGCFWCLETVFERLRGVVSVESGYAGGHVKDPTYRQVCSGTTGHAEVVRVEYDPEVVPYRSLLEVFFGTHDPTTLNRQGPDTGTQYRSIILYENEAQRDAAAAMIEELTAEGTFDDSIVTQLEPLDHFWPAEEEHRQYYRNHPEQAYCQAVIAPKVTKLRERFADRLKPGTE